MLMSLLLAALMTGAGSPTPPVSPLRIVAPFSAPAHDYASGHRGIDLKARPGQPVISPVSGWIAFSGAVAGKPVVTIELSDGSRVTLEPVESTLPVGTRVNRGDPLGAMARTGDRGGHCGGPTKCLHLGLIDEGRYLDPTRLLMRLPVLKPLGADGGRARSDQDEGSSSARG